jgi:hypothetical protein
MVTNATFKAEARDLDIRRCGLGDRKLGGSPFEIAKQEKSRDEFNGRSN